jgi:hypothetical protein
MYVKSEKKLLRAGLPDFLVQYSKTGKKLAVKCTNLFHSRALKNIPILGFFVIWQPWFRAEEK